jgi:hypothetical protein
MRAAGHVEGALRRGRSGGAQIELRPADLELLAPRDDHRSVVVVADDKPALADVVLRCR